MHLPRSSTPVLLRQEIRPYNSSQLVALRRETFPYSIPVNFPSAPRRLILPALFELCQHAWRSQCRSSTSTLACEMRVVTSGAHGCLEGSGTRAQHVAAGDFWLFHVPVTLALRAGSNAFSRDVAQRLVAWLALFAHGSRAVRIATLGHWCPDYQCAISAQVLCCSSRTWPSSISFQGHQGDMSRLSCTVPSFMTSFGHVASSLCLCLCLFPGGKGTARRTQALTPCLTSSGRALVLACFVDFPIAHFSSHCVSVPWRRPPCGRRRSLRQVDRRVRVGLPTSTDFSSLIKLGNARQELRRASRRCSIPSMGLSASLFQH